MIVDAVAEAYKEEVLGNETADNLTHTRYVGAQPAKPQCEIKRKYEDYLDIAKGMGRADRQTAIFDMQLDMKRMDRIDEELAQLEREQLRIETGGDGKDSKFVSARMAQLRKRQSELENDTRNRSERSVDLRHAKSELKQLQTIANEMSVKLEKMDIDSQLPSRIRQVQQAVIEPEQVARQ